MPRSQAAPLPAGFVLAATLFLVASCGEGGSAERGTEGEPDGLAGGGPPDVGPPDVGPPDVGSPDVGGPEAGTAAPGSGRRVPRSDDPTVVNARKALDEGRVELAEALVERAAQLVTTEGPLLRARLVALQGAGFEVLRLIEDARRIDREDGRVYATAAELHAAAGRLDEADREIRRGLEAVGGVTPELVRARGVHLISVEGQARHGLQLLEQALEQDPDLPYVARALGQAHLLVAREDMREGEIESAQEHVDRSLASDPDDLDARRLRGDILFALGEWGLGIQLFEELLAEGVDLRIELATYCKNAGFWAVTQDEHELGIRYYRRALELGFPHEELGHGRATLDAHASEIVATAATKLAEGGATEARELLEEALLFDPESLEAHNFLGHALYLLGDMEGAAKAWVWVVDTARLRKIELPEPVHLKLAQVLAVELNRFDDARLILEAYLVLEPTGAWIEQTRQVLARLPAAADSTGGDQSGGDD